jgi:Tol biopolymer transport system component
MLEYRNVTFTSDSQSLLTVGFEASSRMSIATVTGDGERHLPEDRTSGGNGLTWSADGQRILYLKAVREIRQVWTMAADGSDAREVVGNASWGGLAASADGRSIVYTAERNGTRGIFVADVDGSNERMLAPFEDANRLVAAPDRRQVYFTSFRDGSAATYRLSLDGGPASLVAAGLERAAPSPDGRLLAGLYKASPEAAVAVGIVDAVTGRVVNTIGPFAAATGSGGFGWLPDGKTLIFTTAERFNLFSQPALGGAREQLTKFNEQWIVRFALSPNGKSVLFCRGTALRDAVLMTGFR